MSGMLSADHFTKISGWYATKHRPKFNKEFMKRTTMVYFVAFNLVFWALCFATIVVW